MAKWKRGLPPKNEGVSVWVRTTVERKAFWDEELKRWVLDRSLLLDSLRDGQIWGWADQ